MFETLPVVHVQLTDDNKFDCYIYVATHLEANLSDSSECYNDLKQLKEAWSHNQNYSKHFI